MIHYGYTTKAKSGDVVIVDGDYATGMDNNGVFWVANSPNLFVGKNLSLKTDPLPNGSILIDCNCMQWGFFDGENHNRTNIGTGLTFVDCNCCNVKRDGNIFLLNSITEQVDYCSHLSPGLGLPEEPEECRHVTEINKVIVSGETISEYVRENTYLGT